MLTESNFIERKFEERNEDRRTGWIFWAGTWKIAGYRRLGGTLAEEESNDNDEIEVDK